MLELGKTGAHGVGSGVRPVLSGDDVVATMRASNWKEAATVLVAGREWAYAKRSGRLTGRWAADPEGAELASARRTSFWRDLWAVDLEGVTLERRKLSWWSGTSRYLLDGRQLAVGGRARWGSGRPTLDCDPQVAIEHQVFLLWLELVLTRRAAAAAA